MGRKPIPTQLKLLRGNPGKRPINQDEPQPEVCIPRAPKHLDAEAKKEWKRITHFLFELGLLSELDVAALSAYCVTFSRWIRAEKEIQKTAEKHGTDNGELILTKEKKDKDGNVIGGGNIIQNPYLAIANRALKQMKEILPEFGMTPSSRSKIHVGGPKQEDEFETFLSQANKRNSG